MTGTTKDGIFPEVIEGLDCRRLSDEAAAGLLERLFRARVLVIRGQTFSEDEYARFMRRLGPTIPHALAEFCLPAHRDVLVISNLYDGEGRPVGVHEGGSYWHTDMSYLDREAVLTSLYAVEVPPEGGETRFLDCVAGLELLRSRLARRELPALAGLDPDALRVLHRFGNRARERDPGAAYQPLTEEQGRRLPHEVVHPLVLRHHVTGAESLYAVAATSVGIEGMPRDRAVALLDTLLDLLLEHAPRYAHRYRRGDVVLWDNASTLHCGPDVPPTSDRGECRLLLRANVDYRGRPW